MAREQKDVSTKYVKKWRHMSLLNKGVKVQSRTTAS